MKNLAVFLLICSAWTSFAERVLPGKYVSRESYYIQKDVENKEVPKGKCLVRGSVYHSGVPHPGGLISTLDRKHSVYANDSGYFELYLDDTDTSLFFFQEGLEEIVIWKYKFRSQHEVTIRFNPGINVNMMTVDKPVIYLYNDEPIEADIRLSVRGNLTFTYPAYHDGWKVRLDGQGGLTDREDNKAYPYLFWEGQDEMMAFSSVEEAVSGFYINTTDVVPFFEEQLTALGLNQKEKTDFITFWTPKMMKSPYAMIQFIVDDEYAQKIAGITCDPRPESCRRIYMLYAPMQDPVPPVKIVNQEFTSFVRNGFTLVEWGGSEIMYNPIMP